MSSFIPDSAPFNEEQRAWLNGFFAGLMGMKDTDQGSMQAAFDSVQSAGLIGTAVAEEEDFPWHDAGLAINDRMEMAKEKPLSRKLMAAMAQLDCGSCGYLCQTYSEAIADGSEANLTLCSPGGKETKQMIKLLLKEGDGKTGEGKAAANGRPAAQSNGSTSSGFSRQNPFAAKLIESRTLNKTGSAKDVRHVAIDLAGSGLTYQVGDALGILPSNCPELVESVIAAIGANASEAVTVASGKSMTLAEAICDHYCLKVPSDELLELLADRVADDSIGESLKSMLDDGAPVGMDVLDALTFAVGCELTGQELVAALEPLNPRLYSIASSMRAVGDQVHLTVGKVTYEHAARLRKGVASTLLSDRVAAGQSLRVFVHKNHGGFTVPADANAPMIMVGPGTGIAPFVAFLQERHAAKCPGPNWLFFGDQKQACDFLYESELNEYVASGLLTRLDTAFSRDGENKVYVQDRMRESGKELWDWLQRGAYFFVCGDASRMASDVDKALVAIVAEHGGKSADEAAKYVKSLTASKRYVRDVY